MIIDTTIGENDIGNEVYKFFWNEETYKNPKSKDPAGKFEALLARIWKFYIQNTFITSVQLNAHSIKIQNELKNL